MASSKVVSTNTDLQLDSCISSSSSLSNFLLSDLASNSMDDLLISIYPSPSKDTKPPSTTSPEDVWKEVVSGTTNHRPSSDNGVSTAEEITLEDFLTKTGAVREEDVRGGGVMAMPMGVNNSSSSLTPSPHYPLPNPSSSSLQQSNGSGFVKGKRRAVEEPLDKATLQKQKRMIKNRESAARSRERKQAYTSELESLVQQLEEENARLVNERIETEKQRFKQLIRTIIPVVEKRKTKQRLQRTNSTQSL